MALLAVAVAVDDGDFDLASEYIINFDPLESDPGYVTHRHASIPSIHTTS